MPRPAATHLFGSGDCRHLISADTGTNFPLRSKVGRLRWALTLSDSLF